MRPCSRFLSAAVLSLTLLVVAACGGARQTQSYTFTKPNMTEQALLDDEKQLRGIDGVEKVFPKIDAKNTVHLEVVFDEADKADGLRYLSNAGYTQVRN